MDADEGSAAQDPLSLEELIVEEYLLFLEREPGSINWVWSVLGDLLTGVPERGGHCFGDRSESSRSTSRLPRGRSARGPPSRQRCRDHRRNRARSRAVSELRLALAGLYPHAIARSVRERIVALIPDGAADNLWPGGAELENGPDRRGGLPTLPGIHDARGWAAQALSDALFAGLARVSCPGRPRQARGRRSPGPEGDLTASSGDILQAVIETLARDGRKDSSARIAMPLVVLDPLPLWNGEARRRHGHDAAYRVWAYQMEENELKVLSGH